MRVPAAGLSAGEERRLPLLYVIAPADGDTAAAEEAAGRGFDWDAPVRGPRRGPPRRLGSSPLS